MEISNGFNNFFVRIGKEISDSVPLINRGPEHYIYPQDQPPTLNLTNVTAEYLVKLVKEMASKNGSDIDGVSPKMLKNVINVISSPLAHIFNLSLQNGKFPAKLKRSRVIPIFKSGCRSECDNYRPISMLSSISKILEKVVAKKLLKHLLDNDLIYEHQYGFIPKRSTEQNLLQLCNYVTTALNDGMYCIGVFIDLRKAFDVCSHDILLKKLKSLGITGISYKWFESYLSERMQSVDVNETLSEEKLLNISVIQGSILGTILFLCYINDLFKCTSMFSILFADDGSCLSKGKNLPELISYVNSELQKVANWFLSNKMAINTAKTKFIVFRTKGKLVNDEICKIYFNNNELGKPENPNLIFDIERIHNQGMTKSFKLLGVLLDEYLTFDSHIDMLSSKISKSLYIINRVKNLLPKKVLLSLYFALVHSHLSYCISIYGCANKTSIEKLILKQKKAMRIIFNVSNRAHTAPLFQELKILNIEKMITYSKTKIMHNFFHDKLPFSFNGTWLKNNERNPDYNLRNGEEFYIQHHHYSSLTRLPLFSFPAAWNMCDQTKHGPNIKAFLKKLKISLLNNN